MKRPKPKYSLCWHCNGKLNKETYVKTVLEKHIRYLHKACARHIEESLKDWYGDYYDLYSLAVGDTHETYKQTKFTLAFSKGDSE